MNMAVEMDEESLDISEYLKMFKRRKKYLIFPAAVIFSIALIAALVWPATYRSSATILIEEQQIPRDLVQSTITSYAAQQIEVIKARIMTSKNILSLIEKYKLYDEAEVKSMARSGMVKDFTEKVSLDVLSAGVVDPRSGRLTEATIAFSLSFEHGQPDKAQKVTSELVNFYLNENLRSRNEKTVSTSQFLKDETAKLEGDLDNIEAELAEFKTENEGSLPELYQYNLSVIERSEREMLDLSLRIKELEKRKIQLESELAQMTLYAPTVMADGTRVLSDYDRLKSLHSERRQRAAIYSAEHPDVIRLGREIEVLEQELGVQLSREELLEQKKGEQDKLEELRSKYTADHPKVLTQQRVVAAIDAEVARNNSAAAEQPAPDNPAYVLLDTQLKSVITEIQILKENELEVEAKINRYEESILKAPMVEKKYTSLQRDRENASFKYQEIKAKLMSAELAQNLESGRKGERFTLVDPPLVPEEPDSPNRPVILFLGFVLALGVGVVSVIVVEFIQSTVRGKKKIAQIVGVAPLVVVPMLENEEKNTNSSQLKYILAGGGIAGITIALITIHFAYKPLDVLVFVILRKFGLS